MKPVLKWAGGKARLAPEICDAFGEPCEGTYYEPFLGAAAVFLYRRSRGRVGRAVLSDVNPKLVALHVALRDDVDGVIRELGALPIADWKERYYDVRDAYNEGPWEGALHAARFLWLNKAGYNGLYRENRHGRYNVPIGRYAQLSLPAESALRGVAALLAGTEIRCCSFEVVMSEAGPGDHVYCDPPYVPLSATASFTGYSSEPFGAEEQQRLARSAQRAALAGARVVLSNHDLPVVRNELYPPRRGFEHVSRPRVARAISRKAQERGTVGEIVAAIGPVGRRG